MEQIKEILAHIKLFCRFDVAVTEKLEQVESRLYALEEDNKRNTATVRSLEKHYSEMLLVIRDLKRSV